MFNLHGSLNWFLSKDNLVAYQDLRPVYRHGGNAAIVPPVPAKLTPPWLETVWRDAAASLARADVWVICGYSLPSYDTEVAKLLCRSGRGRSLKVLVLSPEADLVGDRLSAILPLATVTCLPGLPEATRELAERLRTPI